jgi:hypothetical protein
MPVWTAFWHLIERSLVYMPKIISGNWTGILLPLVVFIIREGFRARKEGRRSVNWKGIEKDTLWLIGAYLVLFGWAVVHTVYQDHEDLLARVKELSHPPGIPDLQVDFEGIMTGYGVDNGDYRAAFGVQISNPTGPPRALENFHLSLDWNGLHRDSHVVLGVPSGPAGPYNHILTIQPETLCTRVMAEPIPTGGTRQCWVWAGFGKEIGSLIKGKEKNGAPSPTFVLRFYDVMTGKLYVVKHTLPAGKIPTEIF